MTRGKVTRSVVSTSLSVGLATGLYGVSFGAIATAAGLNAIEVMLLSLLMFSGGSQFAFIGVIAAGGSPVSAIASAWLLGVRNGFYALRMAPLIKPSPLLSPIAAQLTIDESTAVALAQQKPNLQRLGFWVTGASVFVFWGIATFLGIQLGEALGDPTGWGLDAAAAAAFLALIWPRLKDQAPLALAAALAAIALSPVLPAGLPILAAAVLALAPWGRKK